MRIDVDGGMRVLTEDALVAPIAEVGGGAGIYIVRRIVIFFATAKDDPDEVMRAGRVIVILQRGSDFVVRLSHYLGRGNLLGIVTQRAKGMNVSHGNL